MNKRQRKKAEKSRDLVIVGVKSSSFERPYYGLGSELLTVEFEAEETPAGKIWFDAVTGPEAGVEPDR